MKDALVNFLMEEIEDIVFLYRKDPSSVRFSQYSVELLGIPQCIENPLQNEMIQSRFQSVVDCISRELIWDGRKHRIDVYWMHKPFYLHYQTLDDCIIFRLKENLYD